MQVKDFKIGEKFSEPEGDAHHFEVIEIDQVLGMRCKVYMDAKEERMLVGYVPLDMVVKRYSK